MAEEQKEEISGASQLPAVAGPATAPPPNVLHVTEGPETAAAVAAQTAPPADVVEPLGWGDALAEALECQGETALDEIIAAAEVHFVELFGEFPHPDAQVWGIYNPATTDLRAAMLRYIADREPSAETLFIWLGGKDFEALEPVQRASFELLVRLVPAVLEVFHLVRDENRRRLPPPEPGEAVPVPIEDTIFEEVPGFGDRMER